MAVNKHDVITITMRPTGISGETTYDHQENADKELQTFPNTSESKKEILFSSDIQKLLAHNQQLEACLKISSQQCDMLMKNFIDRGQRGKGNTSHLEARILNLVQDNQGLNIEKLELIGKITNIEQLKQNFENRALELKLMYDNVKLELGSKILCVKRLREQLGQKCAENHNLIQKNRELTSSLSSLASNLNCSRKFEIWCKEQHSRLKDSRNLLTQNIFEIRVQLLNRSRDVESLQIEVAKWKSKCDEIQLELQHAKKSSRSLERKMYDGTSVKNVVENETITANGDACDSKSELDGELKELRKENKILKQYIREQEEAFAKINKDYIELMHKYLIVQQKLELSFCTIQDLNKNLSVKTAREAEHCEKLSKMKRMIANLKTELDANIQEKCVMNNTVRTIRQSFAILKNKFRILEEQLAQKNNDILQLQKEKQESLGKRLEQENDRVCPTCGVNFSVLQQNDLNPDETDNCRLMDLGDEYDSKVANLLQIDSAVERPTRHQNSGGNEVLGIKKNNLQEICGDSKLTAFSSSTENCVPHQNPQDIGRLSHENLILMLAKIIRIFNCDMGFSNIMNNCDGIQYEMDDLKALIEKISLCCEITKRDNRIKDEIIYKMKNMNNQQNELIGLITNLEEKCGQLQRKICRNNAYASASLEWNLDNKGISGEFDAIGTNAEKLLLHNKIVEKPYKVERYRRLEHRLLKKTKKLAMKKNSVEKRLGCLKKLYCSLLKDPDHMKSKGLSQNEEIGSLQNISNEDNEETQNNPGENEPGLIFEEKNILSKESPKCIDSSDFESPQDDFEDESSCVTRKLKKCETIEQNMENAPLPRTSIFWNSSLNELGLQKIFTQNTDHRNHFNAEIKLNNSTSDEISGELKRLQDERTDNEKRYSKKYSEMRNLIIVLKSQLDSIKCELESAKNEKFFLQRLCSDLRVALKAHMDLNQEQRMNFFRTVLPSLPVMPNFDENQMNQLIKENEMMCQVKPLSGCQEEFQKLRKKVVMLQKQILKKENRDILDVRCRHAMKY